MDAERDQESGARPPADPADSSWILIDDTAEAEPPSAAAEDSWTASGSWGEPPGERPDEHTEAPRADAPEAPGSQGWDSFSSAGTWNGMRASAAGAGGGWGVPGYDAGRSDPGRSDTGRSDTGQRNPGRSDPGRSDPGRSDPGGSGPDRAARDPWFAENDIIDDYSGDSGSGSGSGGGRSAGSGRISTLADRLPSLRAMAFGPGFVTFLVVCGSLLLVVSSIRWHPHVP